MAISSGTATHSTTRLNSSARSRSGWPHCSPHRGIVHGLVRVQVALLRALLGPTRGELERSAARSEAGRTSAVAADATHRRRIERDLHDGAQARLVGLAVDLGRARERLEAGADTAEATELVRVAHEEAKIALSEVRDLARGIHPAILADRGLDPALSSLAARVPVPVDLSVRLQRTGAGRGGGRGLLRRLRSARERRTPRRRHADRGRRRPRGRRRLSSRCAMTAAAVRSPRPGRVSPACGSASRPSTAYSSWTARRAGRRS